MWIEPRQVSAKKQAIGSHLVHELLKHPTVIEDGGQLKINIGEITGQSHSGVPVSMTGMTEQEFHMWIAVRDLLYHGLPIIGTAPPGVCQHK